MLKSLILCSLLFIFSKAEKHQRTLFIDDLVSEVTTTLDANVSDSRKIDAIKKYVSNLKYNDQIPKKKSSFNIMSHNENFLLFGSHSSDKVIEKQWNDNGTRNNSKEYIRDTNEAQFQLSIKVPLYINFMGTGAYLFTAYTQNSYWQVYDTKHSSPFRETNYMPEFFLEWQPNTKFGNNKLEKVRLSIIHQSNGQNIGYSRSWNRSELYFLLQNQNIFYGFNIWDRWNEKEKKDLSSSDGDDNVGLENYIGKQKYFIQYKNNIFNITLAHQNDIFNYHSSKGNSKIDLTFPSGNDYFNFFIRYFNGYGESLIDYDVKIKRVSFGVIISDWN